MNNLKTHHIGYLVKKIHKTLLCFEGLGYKKKSKVIRDEYRGIDICFLEKDGYCIELVSPYSEDSVVSGMLKKLGNCPYHICYSCSDIDKKLIELREQGFVQLEEKHEAVALNNRKVCFMVSPFVGMIELMEES